MPRGAGLCSWRLARRLQLEMILRSLGCALLWEGSSSGRDPWLGAHNAPGAAGFRRCSQITPRLLSFPLLCSDTSLSPCPLAVNISPSLVLEVLLH